MIAILCLLFYYTRVILSIYVGNAGKGFLLDPAKGNGGDREGHLTFF
jgi:hypothetical protein